MARNRTISPDFWTWEAVIDCKPMTRLLFIGLWNFADDFGVQPLRPRTIRLQVFPGDTIENDGMRAMIEELAARGLVRIYAVDGTEYVAIVDWDQLQRVGKRARRRYPPVAAAVSGVVGPDERPALTITDHRIAERPRSPQPGEAGEQPSPTMENHSNDQPGPAETGAERESEPQRMRRKVKALMRDYWRRHAAIDTIADEVADRWTAKWIAEGGDYGHDIYPAVRDLYVMQPSYPPTDWRELDARLRRPAAPA